MQPVGKTNVLRFDDLETIGYKAVARVLRAAGDAIRDTAGDGE